MILIDWESGSRAIRRMVDQSRAALAQGRSVLIFPEGTRKQVFAPIEFKRRVELLYEKLDTLVLPVSLKLRSLLGGRMISTSAREPSLSLISARSSRAFRATSSHEELSDSWKSRRGAQRHEQVGLSAPIAGPPETELSATSARRIEKN
jgi:hypothetical protein